MELTLKQAAEIFAVSETRVIDWVTHRNLPTELVSNQYRFHRADLLEWAASHAVPFSPSIYVRGNDELTSAGTHLADALESGGVLADVPGEPLRELLQHAFAGLSLPDGTDESVLIDLFLAREDLGCTVVAEGVGVPHPRQPVLLPVPTATMRLCYLREPRQLSEPGHRSVDTLFFLVCSTAHEHLQLLARLSALLQVASVRDALRARTTGKALFDLLRDMGRRFQAGAT